MNKTTIYYIIDDDIDDQRFLIDVLTEIDPSAQCYTAFNGRTAINNLKNHAIPLPDTIFLDINMPGLNGKECLAEFKRMPHLEHIPIIMYTTSSNKLDIQETIQMGAFYFLTKKPTIKELRSEILVINTLLGEYYSSSIHFIPSKIR
jgi:CheY-like chemotaxis protein